MLSLTIFTPTYNRAKTIVRTYRSLLRQQSFDFEWIVVDDGSTDETENLITKWVKEAPFSIKYIKQKNGGKYRAYNNGLRNANGELFFCVDSDDWLLKDSVCKILNIKRELNNYNNIAGCVALKCFKDQKLISKAFPNNLRIASIQDLERLGFHGERSLIFKTSIAKLYMFPEKSQETFMTEAIIYDRYIRYDFLIKNEVLTICEYQNDGLTHAPRKLMVNNPGGYKLFFLQRIDLSTTLLRRIKYAISYNAFKFLYKGKEFEYNGSHSVLVRMLSPIGKILGIFYKISCK